MKADESAPLTYDRDRVDGWNVLRGGEVDDAPLNAEHGGGRGVYGYLWASARGAGHFDPCLAKHPPNTRQIPVR
jgi:hypothetical protein